MATTLFSPREIVTRKGGLCWTCSKEIKQGERMWWHKQALEVNGRARSPVWHTHCRRPVKYTPPNGSDEHEELEPRDMALAPNSDPRNANTWTMDTNGMAQPVTQGEIAPPDADEDDDQDQDASAALKALARALGGKVGNKLDEQRVREIAAQIAQSTYQQGLAGLNQQLGQRVVDLANQTLNARAKSVEDALRALGQDLEAKINPAQAKAAAYEGTKLAIEEANAAGVDTSKLAVPVPVPSLDPLYQDDNETSHALRYCLSTGRNLLASGPSGAGKTFPIRMECAKAGRPVVELSAGDGIGYSHLIGCMTLERDAQGGVVTGWRNGALLRAMLAGAVLILDEIDQLPRPLLALLYGVLEPGRAAELYVPELGQSITAKAGFMVAGTGNTVRDSSGLYSGERPSAALLNRLACVPADYLSAKAELAIFQRCGLSEKQAKAVRASLEALRVDYQKGALTVAPSTRTGVQVARAMLGLMPDGSKPAGLAVTLAPDKAWTLYLLGALPDDERKKAELALTAAHQSAGVPWK